MNVYIKLSDNRELIIETRNIQCSHSNIFPFFLHSVFVLSLVLGTQVNAQVVPLVWMKDSQAKLEKELSAKYGEAQRPRLHKDLNKLQISGAQKTEMLPYLKILFEKTLPAIRQHLM